MRPSATALSSELSRFDAVGLAELIRTAQITPRELVDDTIRKIEAVNPKLNAVVHTSYDRARRLASLPRRDGVLAGVPYLVKDNAEVAGFQLTRGSRALRNHIAERTAPVFSAAERAGLILLGVTNMPELGLLDGTENVLYGPTRNPWHPDYSPGGSSGGAAACVAAGVLPIAHATDGGGSVRIPASHCALFGLKPSRGRLLRGGFGDPPWPRMVEACLSRSVRDTAAYLSLLEDPDTGLPKLRSVPPASRRPLKIALIYQGMLGGKPHAEVRTAIIATAHLCSALGHKVEEAALPIDQARLGRAADQIIAIEVAKVVAAITVEKKIARLEDAFEARALGLREKAMRGGAFSAQLAAAIPILHAGTFALDCFFQDWDVLLTPVVSGPAFKIGMRDQTRFSFETLDRITREYAAYTSLHNVCGTPAMSVPLHWDSQGLPIGSQFAARAGAEALLLSLAYELEEARPWAGKRPAIFAAD